MKNGVVTQIYIMHVRGQGIEVEFNIPANRVKVTQRHPKRVLLDIERPEGVTGTETQDAYQYAYDALAVPVTP